MQIDNIENKSKIAIVAVGYNRILSLKRLLGSLLKSNYPEGTDVPLVISIDCSNDKVLYDYVENFEWPYGEKYVFIQKNRLGLKEHILKCGDLTKYFKAIVLFEDDIYAGRYFYDYVSQAVDYYYEDENIAQISLYNSQLCFYSLLPFCALNNGYDAYASQDVSTWGECWTDRMWAEFRKFMNQQNNFSLEKYEVPETMKKWTKAWSVYYIAYILDTKKFILTPYVSHSTNFNDAGVHNDSSNTIFQVDLMNGYKRYEFGAFKDLVKYDIFYNNISIYCWIDKDHVDLSLDLYNFRPYDKKRFILTTAILPYKVIRSYGLQLRPVELNIKEDIEGQGIYLYDTNESIKTKPKFDLSFIEYLLHGFNNKKILKFIIYKFRKKYIKRP